MRKTPRYSGSAALLLALAFVQLDCGGESAVSRPGTAGSAGVGGDDPGGTAGSSSAGTTTGASANGGANQTGGTNQIGGTTTGGTGAGGSNEPMGGMGDTAGAPTQAGASGEGGAAGAEPIGGAGGMGNASCLVTETDCNGECANLDSDAAHCGDCAIACGPNEVCNLGLCDLQCGESLTECEVELRRRR